MKKLAVTVFFGALISLGLVGYGFSQSSFYEGKTITVVLGTAPGGTGDMRVRAQILFLRKYIPGNPATVVEFMPGGGGRKAGNYIYRAARRDGLTIGAVTTGFVPAAVLGETGVLYDLDRFSYLGSPDSGAQWVFVARKDAGINSLEKLRSVPGLRIGAQSVGHTIYLTGRLFAYLLDMKEPKFVTGYSSPELDLALMRGEVDGRASLG